jgi:predicted nucleic-acid-binding protein
MIGLDTNVLVRYLTQDDPIQSRRAIEFIDRHLTEDDPGYVSAVVVAETVWVLERAYKLENAKIADCIERILQTAVLVVQNEQQVFAAMTVLKDGSGSFADGLILALATKAGCSKTVTFDRKALRLTGFVPV